MNTQNEVEYRNGLLKQLEINNKLLVLIGKILLEAHQGQIGDKDWHKWDDKLKDLKEEI